MTIREILQEDRIALNALMHSAGYQALIRLAEMECGLLECDLVDADPADDAKVLSAHKTARAARMFWTNLQKRIDFECGEALVKIARPSTEEEEISSTVNPIQ